MTNRILLVKFYVDCGRMGELDGTMLVDATYWDNIQGKEWYASEVLGKYSEFKGTIGDEADWTVVRELTEEQVALLAEIFDIVDLTEGYTTLAGFNPMVYVEEEEEDDD